MSVHPIRGAPWRDGLRYTGKEGKGPLARAVSNAVLILTNAPEWVGRLGFNRQLQRVEWIAQAPLIDGVRDPPALGSIDDPDLTYICTWFAAHERVDFGRDTIAHAVELAALTHPFHPLRDYLSALVWDRVVRLPTWLRDYFGAAETGPVTAFGTWWMISAVARAYDPGCKVDHMLVLEGGQGPGKTEALYRLAVRPDWFLGTFPDLRNPHAPAMLAGRWIGEVGELDALRGAALTRVKDFLTQRHDVYIGKWVRFAKTLPRAIVLAGTTNEYDWNRDPTGARRFWPVRVGKTIHLDALTRDRDQLWAEAVHRYCEHERWWPEGHEHALLAVEQEARYEGDEWETKLADWLAENPAVLVVRPSQLYEDALGLKHARDLPKPEQNRVGACMTRLGWERTFRWQDGRSRRVWVLRSGEDPSPPGGETNS